MKYRITKSKNKFSLQYYSRKRWHSILQPVQFDNEKQAEQFIANIDMSKPDEEETVIKIIE